jgi:hypothetical protein
MTNEYYVVARNRLEAIETVANAVNSTSFLVDQTFETLHERRRLMAPIDSRFTQPIFKVTLTAEQVTA